MRQVIGTKHRSTNDQWLYAAWHIEELVSEKEVETYADWAKERIEKMTRGKHAAFAYSGGKDSIVLADLCRQVGINEGYFAYCDLDYPAFIDWIRKNKPAGVTMMHTGYDLDWLAEHQELIFARGAIGQRWHMISQRGPFTKMFFDNNLDVLLMGHRTIDANVCGSEGLIKKNTGEVRYAPLHDWPHELLLGYIHYHKLPLPPIYGWKDGYTQGTHAWPERDYCDTLEQGYREVYNIDPDIIIKAAEKIPSAADFLRKMGGEAR